MDFELTPRNRNTIQPLMSSEDVRNSQSKPRLHKSLSFELDNMTVENHRFKATIFFEFFLYFLLKAFFGPLFSFLLSKLKHKGMILAHNLQVNEGRLRSCIWFMKFYCIVTTFLFIQVTSDNKISLTSVGHNYNSLSQLWLLVHTEISLSVLYGAYYASLNETDIYRLRTQKCVPGPDIFDRMIDLIRLGKTKYYEIASITRSFPEINIDNFYFVFPSEAIFDIPKKLEPEQLRYVAPKIKNIGIQDGLVVKCSKYANYIAEIGGYQEFDLKVRLIHYTSRALVFVNAIFPLINNVYNILSDDISIKNLYVFGFYFVQQIFYSILLYRLAHVYDVLFLGLLLYYKKYKMLCVLEETIKLSPSYSDDLPLCVPTTVPQNILNWLAVRRILSSINGQAFIVIDVNISFVLFYTLIFIGLYAMTSFNILSEVFYPFRNFLAQNSGIQAVLTLTVLVVIFVLTIDIIIGILINRLYMFEAHYWILQENVIMNMKINNEIFLDTNSEDPHYVNRSIIYSTKMKEIRSLLGTNLNSQFLPYIKRIRDSILTVIKSLGHEEFYNPHTLLYIRTDLRLVIALFTAISTIGLNTILRVLRTVFGG